MAALIPFSEALRLDAELVRLARGASSVRLAVGDALDALSASGGHHELGFSSLEAYARERCERSGRWAADTRALARKLRHLPRIREALCAGAIGWSTAELLARHISGATELEWLEKAQNSTVRELRQLLAGAHADDEIDTDEPTHRLTITVPREDSWAFEAARKVAEAVVGPLSSEALLSVLLSEAYSTLLNVVPERERAALYELEGLEHRLAVESQEHAAWCDERKHWRDEAEALCEPQTSWIPVVTAGEGGSSGGIASIGDTPEALDRAIRRACSELAERDLALGIVAESARKSEIWQRLGFATEAQYARERVGVSLSSLKAKRVLAARAGRLPELAAALSSGRIGYEAAYLLSRIATPVTVEEWIRRAEKRTIKHLREEVEAVELLARTGLMRNPSPIDEPTLDALFELERNVVGGDGLGRNQDSSTKELTKGKPHPRSQMSGAGRVTFRWNVTERTYRFWRALERACRARSGFLRFLCENFCRIWLPVLRQGSPPQYFDLYRRDVFRCSSPVCTRRDVTPHHLVFRAHGGGDENENVTSLCVWCHLHGVHEGRIGAEPPASHIRWRIGRRGTVRVEGRTRA